MVFRNERSYKAWCSWQKTRVTHHASDSQEHAYMKLLTNDASDFVINQLELANKVDYQWQTNGNESNVHTSEGIITVTHQKCSCTFYQSMGLPCRHIFSLRVKDGISLYDAQICDARWTELYYRSKKKSVDQAATDDGEIGIDVLSEKTRKK